MYCKDYRRREQHEEIQFEFLGFSYQPGRSVVKGSNKHFTSYTAEISKSNQQKITEAIKKTVNWKDTTMEIRAIADKLNSKLRGWINYFGLYGKTSLRKVMLRLERRLIEWIQKKHKIRSVRKATEKLKNIKKANPLMFYHWEKKYC